MKILVACEESGIVTKAFREQGHEAYSCDILHTSGELPQFHIQGDVLPLLTDTSFDMLIAFPPCTYLSNVGAARLFHKGGIIKDQQRYENGLKATEFFMAFVNSPIRKKAIENPVPSKIWGLPPYTQIIQPWQHGHPYSKRTCLWLYNLPKLEPTNIITEGITQWVNGGAKKADGTPRSIAAQASTFRDSLTKSKTFKGIAEAMAQQWG